MTRQSRLLPRISSAGRFRISRHVSVASPTSARTRTTSAIRFLSPFMLAHSGRSGQHEPHRAVRRPVPHSWPRTRQPGTRGLAIFAADARGTGPARRGRWAPGAGQAPRKVGSPMADLAQFRMLIGGKAVGAISGRTFESQNPYTAESWAVLPDGGPEDVDAAVAAARSALEGDWGQLTGFARAALLRRLGDLVSAGAERLAQL